MGGFSCKEHFSVKHLSPLHDVPSLFVASQWQFDKSQPHIIFAVYRLAVFIFLVITWVTSFNQSIIGYSWGNYLTNWGYTLCVIQSFFAQVLAVASYMVKFLDKPKIQHLLLKLHPVFWVTHSAATSAGFMITIIYWTVLHRGQFLTAVNFFVHGSNSIVLLIDLLVVAHPVRVLHFIYPVIFGIAYLIFSVAYYFYDKDRGGPGYIYTILDWNNPGYAILVVIGILVLLIALHILTFVVYQLRLMIHDKIYPENARPTEKQTQSTEQLSGVV